MNKLNPIVLAAILLALASCSTDDGGPVTSNTDGGANDGVAADGGSSADSASDQDTGTPDAGAADTGPEPCDVDLDCEAQFEGTQIKPCQKIICIVASGKCKITKKADGDSCSDGDKCTYKDKCDVDNECIGTALDCEDGNPCTINTCNPKLGQCDPGVNDPNGKCDDENACTNGDKCTSGYCKSGQQLNCDDNNSCTADSCLPTEGCQNSELTGACSDGDPCTTDDNCQKKACIGGKPTNCNDGNPCTIDKCSKADSGCDSKPLPGSTMPCNDGNPCTENDKCNQGSCKAGAKKNCDDGDQCTGDSCNVANGTCKHLFLGKYYCDDGDACTQNDVCNQVSGKCVGKLINCDDGNSCTDDNCGKGGCAHKSASGTCVDGDNCTVGDKCVSGKCQGGVQNLCNDNEPCTSDLCHKLTGKCINSPLGGKVQCDDSDKCSDSDLCTEGVCKGQPINCDDGNSCTKDLCNPKTGCTHLADSGKPCADSNPCTYSDTCNGKLCIGKSKKCADDSSCTVDKCDTATGNCKHNPIQGGISCNDGNLCTLGDKCDNQTGKCVGSDADCDDGEKCTYDTCNPKTGKCQFECSKSAECKMVPACNKGP
jgi:hypothetical protein